MAKEYIERQKLIGEMRRAHLWNTRAARNGTVMDSDIYIAKRLPAADVVEVEAIEAWLYQIALNNVGVEIGDVAEVCEMIISRLNGLRTFAKERQGAR